MSISTQTFHRRVVCCPWQSALAWISRMVTNFHFMGCEIQTLSGRESNLNRLISSVPLRPV